MLSRFLPLLFAGAVWAQVPDLTISRVEVVQTVQDDAQTVPLTAGKATAIRVFIKQQGLTTPLISNLTALVRGFRNGVEIPLSPLRPVNPAITAAVSPDRNNAQHSQDFIVPLAWTQAGKLELRAELRLPSGVFEFPSDNNNATREVEFVATPSPSLAWLPLCSPDGRCATGSMGYTRLLQRAFPIADATLRYDDVPVPPVKLPFLPDSDDNSAALAAYMERWRLLLQQSPLKPSLLVGWLPRATKTVQPGGGAAPSVWVVEQADSALSEQVLARQFASGYPAGDSCASTIQDPGYDPVASRLIPATRVEFTSYCTSAPGAWVSVPLAKYLAARPLGSEAATAPLMLISATRSASGITLRNAFPVSSVRANPSAAGNLRLRVLTASGAEQEYSLPQDTLTTTIPGGARKVSLLGDTGELARLASAGDTPSVAITGPVPGENIIRWTAADPSNRPLTYVVSYSNDDGATWTPLAVDIAETEFAFDPAYLLPGSLRFRVQASAGLDFGTATTDPIPYTADPAFQTPPSTFDFGAVTTLTYSERGITIRNTGKAPLVLQNFASSDTFPVATPVPFTVRAGTERQLLVRAFPKLSGGDSAILTAETNDPANPTLSITLRESSYDRPVPSITLSVLSLDFGQVNTGQTRDLVFSVSNEGTAALTITNLSALNARFAIVSPTGQFTLQPGESRAITARFTPNAGGVQTGTLSVGSNDPATPTIRVDVRGEGVTTTTPVIEVSPTALDFASVTAGQTRAQSTTVRNAGNGVLSVNSFTTDNSLFRVASPIGPFTLNPGASQVISLLFAPTAAGVQNGVLAILSNDPARARVQVTLTGSATTAPPAPSPRITHLLPSSVQSGIPRFNLTIAGSNFTTASVVTWNGATRPTVFVNSTTLTASIAPEDVSNTANATVGVTNPSPGGPSNTLSFIVNPRGASAQIVNMDLSACPTITSTLTAYDSASLPITVLEGNNIGCSEDGSPVSCVATPALANGSRLSIQLILHTSPDITDNDAYRLDMLNQRRFAISLVQTIKTVDRIGISVMDNGVRSLIEFTEADSRDALLDAVDLSLTRPALGVGTALYDAITDAVRRLNGQTGRRKAIIIFSASTNTYPNSQIPYDDLARTLQSSGIPVYTFALGSGTTNPAVIAILNQIAVDSNGILFNDQTLDQSSVMASLAETLSNQQFVSYTTSRRDGVPHTARFNINKEGASFSVARAYAGCR